MNDNSAIVTMISIKLKATHGVAQVSNLLYRRFPIGSATISRDALMFSKRRRLEALRYSRLETCATPTRYDGLALHIRPPSDFGPPDLRSAADEESWTLNFRLSFTANSLSRTVSVQESTPASQCYSSAANARLPPSEIPG